VFSKSFDGGLTWSQPYKVEDLVTADCNGDLISYTAADGRTILLHSVPNSAIRENVTVFASYDQGKTWPVKKTLEAGYSAYSSLAILPDGTIGCLLESGKWDSKLPSDDGYDLIFVRFSLDWLEK
ncbi:MAG: exo-alpha-sialidase, partial [Bacteroidales bacterium]|nr:exo-alpha-sialidase [Bacteroidales bacterium]